MIENKNLRDIVTENLDNITKLIKLYEEKKYPEPPYSLGPQENLLGKIIPNNKLARDELIIEFKSDMLDDGMLLKIQQAAVKLRKLNIMAGIISAMKYDDYFIENEENTLRILEIFNNEIVNKIADDKKISSPENEINDFVIQLVSIIKENSKLKESEIVRRTRNAERYFVAENNILKPIKIFKTKVNGKTVVQIDEPIKNYLTPDQKKEYLKIHDINNQPMWFKSLPQWEQAWLLKHVPNKLDDYNYTWELFENQSSAMQHLPGIKNGRRNYLAVNEADEWKILSTSLKNSTMVPYEMTKENQKEATENNAYQVISNLSSYAVNNFKKTWGDNIGVKPLVLLQSLLSPVLIISGADKSLANKQSDAIESQAEKFKDVDIIHTNDPMNIFRLAFGQRKQRWKEATKIMDYAENLVKILKQKNLSPEQKMRLAFIEKLMSSIKDLHKFSLNNTRLKMINRRNFEQYKVAYLGLLVEAMGGAVSTNCKSGKDRTGLDELYRHAMQLYYEQYKELPKFTDKGSKRENFIDIFTKLFNTMKTQESAASNTPGSFGLKDSAMVLCKDIADRLGNNYTTSNKRADMNKPKIFKADEKKQTKEAKELLSINESKEAQYTKSVEETALTLQQKSLALAKQLNIYEIYTDPTKEPQPTIKKSTEYFNKLSAYIIHEIVSQSDYKVAANTMAYWVNVLHYLTHDANPSDMFSAYAIYGALNNASILRLKLNEKLNNSDQQKYNKIATLVSTEKSSKNYRIFCKNNELTIPYFGLYISDIISMKEANPNVEKVFQTFAYSNVASSLAINMASIKNVNVNNFNTDPSLSKNIDDFIYNKDVENSLYNKSLEIMPRGTEPPEYTAVSNFKQMYIANIKTTAKKNIEPSTLIIVDDEKEFSYKPPITLKHQNIVLEKEEDHVSELKNLAHNLEEYFTEMDNEIPIGKLRLYSLVTYGDLREFSGKNLERALEKIVTFDSEKNLKIVFEKEKRKFLAEKTMEKYNNAHPEDIVTPNNVILLKEYAYDIITNKSEHLTKDQNAIYEPPERKAMALIYLLQRDPKYLNPTDEGEKIARSEIFLAFINEIKNSPSNYIQFLQKIKQTKFIDPEKKTELDLIANVLPDNKDFDVFKHDLKAPERVIVLQKNIQKELEKITTYAKNYEEIKPENRVPIDDDRIIIAKDIDKNLTGKTFEEQVLFINGLLNNKKHAIHKHKNILHRKSTTLVRHLKHIKSLAEQAIAESKMHDKPPFPGYTDRLAKQGGKNSPGPFGGRYKKYETTENGDRQLVEMAMIKRDTTPKGPREEKVIGEFLAGQLMSELMQGVENGQQRMAHVDLVQAYQTDPITADNDGTQTYLKSTFIKGYKGDFWRHAYAEDRQKKYEKRFQNKSIDIIAKLALNKLSLYYKQQLKRLAKAPQSDSGAQKDFAEVNKKYQALNIRNIKKQLGEPNGQSQIIKEIVDAKLDAMGDKKPALFSQLLAMGTSKEASQKIYFEARDVPSNAIRNGKGFLKEFAEITAPRLLLSDFGVHCANFGVIEIEGEKHLAAIDYGAAFSNFKHDFNPLGRPEKLAEIYKNHLLDYTKDIYKSQDMGKEFIRIGKLDLTNLQIKLKDSVDKLKQFYGIAPLKKFCKRIGMPAAEIDQIKDKNQLGEKIINYFNETLKARQAVLLEVGHQLLVRNCYEDGKFNAAKLQALKTDYPGLNEFILDHPDMVPEDRNTKVSTAVEVVKQSVVVDNTPSAIEEQIKKFKTTSQKNTANLHESKIDDTVPSRLSSNKAIVTETTIVQKIKSLFATKQNIVSVATALHTKPNNSVASDISYDKKKLNKLNKTSFMLLAKEILSPFWEKANPNSTMYIRGDMDKGLVKAMILYCEALNSDPNKKREFKYSNQTKHRVKPTQSEIKEFKTKLDKYIAEQALLKKEQQVSDNTDSNTQSIKTDLFTQLKEILNDILKLIGFAPKQNKPIDPEQKTDVTPHFSSSTANLNKSFGKGLNSLDKKSKILNQKETEQDEIEHLFKKTSSDINNIHEVIHNIINSNDNSEQAINHIKDFLKREKDKIDNLKIEPNQRENPKLSNSNLALFRNLETQIKEADNLITNLERRMK